MICVSIFERTPELARFSATGFILGLGRPLMSRAETTQMLFPSFVTPRFRILRTEVIINQLKILRINSEIVQLQVFVFARYLNLEGQGYHKNSHKLASVRGFHLQVFRFRSGEITGICTSKKHGTSKHT